jgi:hypothetical protein
MMTAIVVMTAPLAAVAQEEAGRAGSEPEGDLEPSTWAVGDPPAPVERVFDKRVRKVWQALVQAVEETGFPIEVADKEAGYLKTKLSLFGREQGWRRVATKPPAVSLERPLQQRMGLNSGRFFLEAAIGRVPEGTVVSLRAYIEEEARHLQERRKIWAERYSNGTIENIFLDKTQEILK